MISPHPLDALAPSFWTRPEAINAWRLCFEDDAHRIRLLTRVLRHLPEERGRLEYLEEMPGDQFVLILTFDLTNNESWQNQAWILSVLAETRAVTALAVEASFSEFDFTSLRDIQDRDPRVMRDVAVSFLRHSKLGPPSFVGVTSSVPIEAFGIDDRVSYDIAYKNIRARNAAYFDAIRRRAPIMLQNMLTEMAKRKLSVVAACLTDYNYDEFRRMLSERKIAHACIRPRVGGPSVSFEEFWTKATARSSLDDLFNPEPGLRGRIRRAGRAVRRWIGL